MSQTSPAAAPAPPRSRRIKYIFEMAGFLLLVGFFRLFSLETASNIGGWIGRKLLAPTGLSKPARRNLAAAFPERTEKEREAILLGMWDNLGRVMAEYGHLDALRWTASGGRFTVEGLQHFEAAKAHGKGLLLISGHFANWELLPFAARAHDVSGASVVRPTNNPYVNAWLDRARKKHGLPELISKGAQGTRRIFTLLRKGDAICMLVDQRTSEGVYVPFFGRDAPTTPVPAALALKLGAVIVPVSNLRVSGTHFRVQVYPPIEPVRTDNHDRDVLETTAAINRFIEDRVRENPAQWLWLHRRWADAGAKPRKRGAQVLSTAFSADADSDGSSRV